VIALANKMELRNRLRGLADSAGAHDPAMLADQLLLLIEGTYVSGQTIGTEGVGQRAAAAAADILVAAAVNAAGEARGLEYS
jgi:hypothetical protein